MQKYLAMYNKNKEMTDGQEIEFDGQSYIIGKMNEEEIEAMRAEGIELLNTEVTYQGKAGTKLKDIKSGKDIFNIVEAIGLEGNISSLWFRWREIRMEERMNNFTPATQKDIKALLAQEGAK